MYKEIGSNFWMDRYQTLEHKGISLDYLGLKIRDTAFLSTGRSAISFVLNQLDVPEDRKVALLPPFTCYTVIDPFIDAGYQVRFYEVDRQMTFNAKRLMEDVRRYLPSVVLVHSYFGINTLAPLKDTLTSIREAGITLIEDVTHMLYSDSHHDEMDYYVGSFRKWAELPDGGFAISTKEMFRGKPELPDTILEEAKVKAFHAKYLYMAKDEGEKGTFMDLFRIADERLETQDSIYAIAPVSAMLQAGMDTVRLRKKRRENYQTLLDGLLDCDVLEPVFRHLAEGAVPLYFPVYVRKERKSFQKYLAEQGIYAPVVWPRPVPCENVIGEDAEWIYEHVLSIPCDQRYGREEMEYILEKIRSYERMTSHTAEKVHIHK